MRASVFCLPLLLLLLHVCAPISAIEIGSRSDGETSTPPSNVTSGSLARGENNVWAAPVPIGPSKKYLECKKLLETTGDLTPAPFPTGVGGGSVTGYHLPAVATPSQAYARAAGMIIFVFVFFLIVGGFKCLTNNVLKNGTESFSPALVVMYSEVSVFAIIGLISFIVLRSDTLPKYSLTFLPGQSSNTMTIMFENVVMTMFMFIMFYIVLGLALVAMGLKMSFVWAEYEKCAGNAASEENALLEKYRHPRSNESCGDNERKKFHKECTVSYLCLRDDFVRNSPGRHGLRGPQNAAVFDFSRA